MAQPWQTIKGGGSATPDSTRQARATKARQEPRAPRLLGWTRTEGQKRWARRLEKISVLAIAFMAVSGVVALLAVGDDPFRLYGIAIVTALVVVHPVAFLADTLSNGDSQLAGWCVIAFWSLLVAPAVIGLLFSHFAG
jgi:hypothetical protein